MATDWIKWVKGLTKRREVLAMAKALGLSAREVASATMEFWEWADSNSSTGFIDGLDIDDIDPIVSITGFGSALATVGWLESRNGGLQLPRWERHNGQSAKRRALETERKRSARKADERPQGVRKVSASDADRKRTREEKREIREEKDVEVEVAKPKRALSSKSNSTGSARAGPSSSIAIERRKAWLRYQAWVMPLWSDDPRQRRSDETVTADLFELLWPEEMAEPPATIVARLDAAMDQRVKKHALSPSVERPMAYYQSCVRKALGGPAA